MNVPERIPVASTPSNVNQPAPRDGVGRRLVVFCVLTLLLLSTCVYSPSALEQLLLGWIYFPLRVLPQVTVDWPTALLGVVCALAFVAGLHQTLRWFIWQLAQQLPSVGLRFSIRSTVMCTIAVVLLFMSGTAMVGASHQVIWLLTGRTTRSNEVDTPPVE